MSPAGDSCAPGTSGKLDAMIPARRFHRVLALALALCILPADLRAQPFTVPTHREDGHLVFDGVPRLDPALADTLARYQHFREATFLDWTARGAMLVSTRFARSNQVHRVAAPLGMREQLTFGAGTVIAARAQPHGAGFVFTRRVGGYPQLYVYDGHGGVRALTHGPYLHGSPVWSPGGKRVAFYGTDRTGVSDDIYVADVSAGTPARLLAAGTGGLWQPCDWSADGARVLVLDTGRSGTSTLYAVSAVTGALDPLLTQNARITAAKFAPDGVGIYFLSDQGGAFERLFYFNPITRALRQVSASAPWDVETFAVSGDGSHVAYVLDEDGRSHLIILDTHPALTLTPPGVEAGIISNLRFDPTGQKLGFSYESSRRPRDAYAYDLATASLTRWTRSELGPITPAGLASAELVHFPTWDRVGVTRRMLSAYVYLPKGAQPCPVLIVLHGGPAEQFRPGWHPFLQFLVNDLGYAVVAPNVRGSSGYGKAFRALGQGRDAGDAVRDVGALLVWIGLQPGFDAKRIALMGDAYGGLLALDSLATYDGHLRGAVDAAGIASLVDYVASAPAAERARLTAEFGAAADQQVREYLDGLLPLSNVPRIHQPVLIVQGRDGQGARAADAQQLVWRLRSQGATVWYLSTSAAGGEFRAPRDQAAYRQTVAQFLRMLAQSP